MHTYYAHCDDYARRPRSHLPRVTLYTTHGPGQSSTTPKSLPISSNDRETHCGTAHATHFAAQSAFHVDLRGGIDSDGSEPLDIKLFDVLGFQTHVRGFSVNRDGSMEL